MLNFSRNGTLASAGVSQMTMPSLVAFLVGLWWGNGCRLHGRRCGRYHRRWLTSARHIRCALVKSSLQTAYLFEQQLLLFFHLAKELSDGGVLRLQGLDFALQVLWLWLLSGRRLSEGRSREERH